MSVKKKPKVIKRLVRLFAIMLVLVLLIHVAANISLELLFRKQIHRLEERSAGRFRIEYRNVFIDLFNRSIGLNGFRLIPVRRETNNNNGQEQGQGELELNIPILRIKGIDWLDFLLNRNLTIDKIIFRRARIVRHRVLVSQTTDTLQSDTKKYPERTLILPFRLKSLKIKKWVFDKCSLDRVSEISDIREFPAIGFSFAIDDCHAAFTPGSNRYSRLDLHSIELTARDIKLDLPEHLPDIELAELGISVPLSKIWITALKLKSGTNKYEYSRKKGYRSTWARMVVNRIHFNRVSYRDLIDRLFLKADQMSVRGFTLEFFRDRKMPLRSISRNHPFVQEAMKRLKFRFLITRCKMSRGILEYQIQNDTDMEPGGILFTEIDIESDQIGNDPSWLQGNKNMNIRARGKVMGKNWLQIQFKIPANDAYGRFDFQGKMHRLNIQDLNPILNQAMVHAETGVINRLFFSGRANKYGSHGVMKLYYNGFKVSLLSKKKQGKKAMFPSFLVNRIILANNPRGRKSLRIGDMDVERRTPRSIFNLIGRSFLAGIKSSIGLKRKKK